MSDVEPEEVVAACAGAPEDIESTTTGNEDLPEVCDVLREMGKGVRIACFAWPSGKHSGQGQHLIGTYQLETKKDKTLWVAWDKDQDPRSKKLTVTAFPTPHWTYSEFVLEPPVRTQTLSLIHI